MDEQQMKAVLLRVKRNLRVTKVVATRSVKGKYGDHFAGFSAAWDSVQDEPAGHGKDLSLIVEDDEVAPGGMTIQEARIAHLMLAMTADIAAHEAALASGGISSQFCSDSIATLKSNYGKMIRRCLLNSDDSTK